jgi:predicted DNA-binding transcriptional regulator YafY
VTTKNTPGRRKGSYSQAARVLAILELVRSDGGPVPLARIAAHFGLSERQARRDVAMLTESVQGVRSVIVDGRSAVVAEAPGLVRLDVRERVLLTSLAGLAHQLGGGVLGDEMRAAVNKLALTAREEREHPITLVAAPVALASAGTAERIDRIEQAIRDRHELRVRVAGEREETRLVSFLPYVIALHPSGAHVVGRWDPGEPVRAVPIDRFAYVEVALGTVVAAPQALDLARSFEAPRSPVGRAAHS